MTPSDSTVLAVTRGLWVGGAGNVAVTWADGGTTTITGVLAGTFLPVAVTQVLATGTTATSIQAWY